MHFYVVELGCDMWHGMHLIASYSMYVEIYKKKNSTYLGNRVST